MNTVLPNRKFKLVRVHIPLVWYRWTCEGCFWPPETRLKDPSIYSSWVGKSRLPNRCAYKKHSENKHVPKCNDSQRIAGCENLDSMHACKYPSCDSYHATSQRRLCTDPFLKNAVFFSISVVHCLKIPRKVVLFGTVSLDMLRMFNESQRHSVAGWQI